MYAVIDHKDRDELPDKIYVAATWQDARERFIDLVADEIQEADNCERGFAEATALTYMSPQQSIYEIGDGYIAIVGPGSPGDLAGEGSHLLRFSRARCKGVDDIFGAAGVYEDNFVRPGGRGPFRVEFGSAQGCDLGRLDFSLE